VEEVLNKLIGASILKKESSTLTMIIPLGHSLALIEFESDLSDYLSQVSKQGADYSRVDQYNLEDVGFT